MIDFHAHIIPGIDDGAKTPADTQAILGLLKEQNIDAVICTSHYYPNEMSVDDFETKRTKAFATINDKQGLTLIPASETYLSELLFNYSDISPLCIGNTDYFLLELPYKAKWDKSVFNSVERLISTFDIIPVIAHVERYAPIQAKPKLIQELIDMDCLIQLNASSVVDNASRKFAFKLLKKGYVDFLGTDVHNTTTRKPEYAAAVKLISEKLGEDVVEELDENAQRILDGIEILPEYK